MGLKYVAVGWNRQKRIYDVVLAASVVTFLVTFVAGGLLIQPNATIETHVIRALATAALLLLHLILSIGPLCRMESRFLPLLYNRRHLGVTMFLLATAHAVFSIIQYHSLGNVSPLISLLTGNIRLTSLSQFPFELLGLCALAILFLMAATSHDFWLANLTAPVWKFLHTMVYLAYALVVLHVVLGILQAETGPLLVGLLTAGVVWILGLHVTASFRERSADRDSSAVDSSGYVDVCSLDEILEKRARITCLSGERVAVFKYDGKISAISNVCQHQNGPLGEGRIIDGCVTCPWHGYQYLPESGSSPPPFKEKIPTFNVRLERGRVLVDPLPNPPGTRVEPASIQAMIARETS